MTENKKKMLPISNGRRAAVILTAVGGVASIIASGGGGGGDGPAVSNTPPPPVPPPAVQSGVFKDRNVSGLAFSSGAESGTTDAAGRFTCETGNDVSFAVGAVDLGSTACATLVTPNQLATDNATFLLELANITRFLQMLDLDGDPENGIEISNAVQQIAASWAQVDFLTADLDAELVTNISDAASVDGTLHTLPTATNAVTHLAETVECAYAGAYAGSISGTSTGAAGMVIGWGAPTFGFIPLNFEWNAFDSVTDIEQFGGGGGSIDVVQLPVIDHTGQGVAGPISAQFTSPDSISGTWSGGTIQLQRIGADDGSPYRLVGKAENLSFSSRTSAYISANFDGTDISGEAFEIFEGTSFQVTGTVNGNMVSITANGGGSSLTGTGTLTRFPDNSPDEITGSLSDGSSFSLVACRLN